MKKVFPTEGTVDLLQSERMQQELQRFEELSERIIPFVKRTLHGLSITVTIKVAGYPRIRTINHGRDIEFEVVLREDYPFSVPEICCNTEFTVPRLNDRRNLLPHLVQKWGPAIMLVDLISRLPDFLVQIGNLNKQLTLHELGQYGRTYWQDEFDHSSADAYKCVQHTGRLVMPRIQSLVVLTDSMILVLVGKNKTFQPNEPLRVQQFSYLDEISEVEEIATNRHRFRFATQKEIVLEFDPATKSKELTMSLQSRLSLWANDKQEKGNITGYTALELQLRIQQMSRSDPQDVQMLKQMMHCLSDAVELFSVDDLERCERYKTALKNLLSDPANQAYLLEPVRPPARKM